MKHHAEDNVVNLDALTYAGNLHNLDSVSADFRYYFVQGNIRNRDLVRHLVVEYENDSIINFAAESFENRSIRRSSSNYGQWQQIPRMITREMAGKTLQSVLTWKKQVV